MFVTLINISFSLNSFSNNLVSSMQGTPQRWAMSQVISGRVQGAAQAGRVALTLGPGCLRTQPWHSLDFHNHPTLTCVSPEGSLGYVPLVDEVEGKSALLVGVLRRHRTNRIHTHTDIYLLFIYHLSGIRKLGGAQTGDG